MRLPAIDEKSNPGAAEIFAEILRTRGTVSDVLRSLAHAPEGLRAFAAYGEHVRYHSGLNGRLRELVILALARGNQYAWTHHVPFALKEGLTQPELDALNDDRLAPTLNAAERAAVEYAREFAQLGQISDATFDSAHAQFGAQGITNLTLLCGYFIVLASIINAFHIELESGRKPLMKPRL